MTLKIGDTIYRAGTQIMVCKRKDKYKLFLDGKPSGTFGSLEEVNKILSIFNLVLEE